MARAQAPLRHWVVGIAAMGVGLFALSQWMSRDVENVAAMAVITMAIVSVVSILRSKRSAFWIGFVVVGWGWLAISLGSSLGPDLPETHWIDVARPPLALGPDPNAFKPYSSWVPSEADPRNQRDRDAYRNAGHCVVSLVLACLGGMATRFLFAVDDREPTAWRVPDGSLFRPNPSDRCDSP